MFKKVIAAEDYESGSIAIQKALEDLQVSNVQYTSYCDDTLRWIDRGIQDSSPFELLITDLSFDEDYREQNIKSGQELIIEVKKKAPNIKVIVFSINKKPKIIENLFQELEINGYVSKDRGDVHELKKAIQSVYKGDRYLSPKHNENLRRTNSIELKKTEITILSLLSQGVLQKNIPSALFEKGITPNSLSSVEKMINSMKIMFNANNNEQLIAICKELGIL